MAEFTPEELATINEIMRQQSGAATTPEEMQMRQQQQPPQNMQGEQGKAQYLQQQIEAIRSRMGGGAPQTGSQRVMDAMGTLPPQQGAMTPEEMQQLQMMRGQR